MKWYGGIAFSVLAAFVMTAPVRAASDPAALAIVEKMTGAHGGMAAWAAAPTVSFIDEWTGSGRTKMVVEQGRRRAYGDDVGGPARLAWDGDKAWSETWTLGTPPRFLALLNYYFLDLPWLVHDPGVILGAPQTGTLRGDSTEYITILMTFESGTGDTPDDYYRLYIYPDTFELRACAYVVTYASLLPEGMKATPEHILVYDTWAHVSGLAVPTSFTIYEGEKVYAKCVITGWSFSEPFDESRMTMPAAAVVDTSKP